MVGGASLGPIASGYLRPDPTLEPSPVADGRGLGGGRFSIPRAVPRHELPAWIAHYVGLPFADLGRDRAGIDCWGLVRLVLAERFEVQVPAWDGRYPGCEPRHMRRMEGHVKRVLPLFEAVSKPEDGDLVLVKVGGLPVHVGIVVAPGWMLHAEWGCDSLAEEILSGKRPPGAIEGLYRWKGEAA